MEEEKAGLVLKIQKQVENVSKIVDTKPVDIDFKERKHHRDRKQAHGEKIDESISSNDSKDKAQPK
jgi:hypothetical protein